MKVEASCLGIVTFVTGFSQLEKSGNWRTWGTWGMWGGRKGAIVVYPCHRSSARQATGCESG